MSQLDLFDYTQLSPELQTTVRLATERIKMRMKRTAEDIIEIGKDLIAIKEQLPHGQFLPWIESEFEMSDQTAKNFMNVAERFPQIPNNLEFKPTILYQLAAPSTPESVVEKAIEKAESGESVTVAEIKQLKADVKALEQRNKDLVMVVKAERSSKEQIAAAKDQLALKLEKTEEELGDIAETKNREFQSTLAEEIEKAKAELQKTIDKQSDVIQKQQKEFEQFKRNPDPETEKKIKKTHDALIEIEHHRDKAESRLNELRSQDDHARLNAIKVVKLKGALEKVIAEHMDGIVATSSPYLPESILCDAETLAASLHDFADRLERSIDVSRQSQRDEALTIDTVAT